MKNEFLEALNRLGQSVWYDNLSRDVLNSGELAKLIASGVSGLTSNPTIFKKAIADTDDYDQAMRSLGDETSDVEAICESLMIEDVAAAADLLKPTFDQTNGADGYASIEVSPFLADDTAGTVAAGKRLWDRLARPNIMIKVPATDAGIPAIESLLSGGVNVNVTLIFSTEVYKKVIDAYLQALENRLQQGLAIDKIASVASFFVSRVDAICEKEAEKLGVLDAQFSSVLGKVGIANSKLAYSTFLSKFNSDRFSALKSQSAMVQRPLWASVGTKNPDFHPLLYIEKLVGGNTVSTMPPATLAKVMKAADISDQLSESLESAGDVIDSVNSMGVPFDDLLVELQSAGVKSFSDSYRSLLDSITNKLEALAA